MLDKTGPSTKTLIPREIKIMALSVVYNLFPIIIFLVCALMLVSAWFYLLEPKFREISSGEELVRKLEEYNAQGLYYKKLVSLRNVYHEISQADKDKINKIVEVPNDSNDLIRELDYLVKIFGMAPEEISPKQTDDSFEIANIAGSSKRNDLASQTRVWMTNVNLTDVTYESLVGLLSMLESNLRLMDVQKVSYDPIKKTASIELLTYHRK